MNRADTYAAFARLFCPAPGDPDAETLLRAIPGGDSVPELRPRTVAGEHLRVFGPTLAGKAPPYETSYGSPHVFQQTQQLADLGGFYAAFGLRTPSIERADHVSIELEFMQYLLAREEDARRRGDAEQEEIALDAQRKFLAEHLGRWCGAFAVRAQELDSEFYARLARLLHVFVQSEIERLGAVPVAVSSTEIVQAPTPEAEDGLCGSCDLSELEQGGPA